MRILKTSILLCVLFLCVFPPCAWALNMEALKVDFLQGNYRRVIFEAQAEIRRMRFCNTEELNYLLALSYLKEFEPELSRECFKRILGNPSGRFAKEAGLGMADTYLVSGELDQAAEMYGRLISSNPGSQEPAILYRLSQLEYRRGNRQKAGEYWLRLKKDFPLSPELKAEREIPMRRPIAARKTEYSVQVGFFTSRSNADNLKRKLLDRNYPAYVEECGTGYRVKVGKFISASEAAEAETRLSREGFETKVAP